MHATFSVLKATKLITDISFTADGEDDSIFLSRLYKALLFRDKITIDNGDGTETHYVSGDNLNAEEI
jgi:hypothetical protein